MGMAINRDCSISLQCNASMEEAIRKAMETAPPEEHYLIPGLDIQPPPKSADLYAPCFGCWMTRDDAAPDNREWVHPWTPQGNRKQVEWKAQVRQSSRTTQRQQDNGY